MSYYIYMWSNVTHRDLTPARWLSTAAVIQQIHDKHISFLKGLCSITSNILCLACEEFVEGQSPASSQDACVLQWGNLAKNLAAVCPSPAWWMSWCLSKSHVIAPQRPHLKYLNGVEHEWLGRPVSKATAEDDCDTQPRLTEPMLCEGHRRCTRTRANSWANGKQNRPAEPFSELASLYFTAEHYVVWHSDFI